MNRIMELRFPNSEIRELAAQYNRELKATDRKLTEAISRVFSSYAEKGFLTKEEYLTVCRWKTPRTQSRCKKNDVLLIREISNLAGRTDSEQLRIQIWTLLEGVGWPTASVFLHFGFPKRRYPILDVRALWSINIESQTVKYSFPFWWKYTEFCRSLASKAGVTMRELDQALWMYSKIHQNQ